MKNCRIHIGNISDTKFIINDLSFLGDKGYEIINGWDEENEDSFMPSTLKDISIIMMQSFGIGSTWQLAEELSKRLKINDQQLVSDVLFNIFEDYENLSDEEAFDKYEKSPKLS
jgi:hypothetical protein